MFKDYLNGDLAVLNQIQVNLLAGEFCRAVLDQMRQIPAGQTISYSQLAKYAGYPGAARAVGSVCKHNPIPLVFPCHRVIKNNGQIGQYALGVELKRKLLHHKGVSFLSGKIYHKPQISS